MNSGIVCLLQCVWVAVWAVFLVVLVGFVLVAVHNMQERMEILEMIHSLLVHNTHTRCACVFERWIRLPIYGRHIGTPKNISWCRKQFIKQAGHVRRRSKRFFVFIHHVDMRWIWSRRLRNRETNEPRTRTLATSHDRRRQKAKISNGIYVNEIIRWNALWSHGLKRRTSKRTDNAAWFVPTLYAVVWRIACVL